MSAATSTTPATVTVPSPTFGSETHRAAQFLVDAAWRMRAGYDTGGSTVRGGIARLLEDVAAQLDPTARTTYDGMVTRDDGTRENVIELTAEERYALPAIYHRPVYGALGTPAIWRCAVCWDAEEATVTSWPCPPAEREGSTIARDLGLEYSR